MMEDTIKEDAKPTSEEGEKASSEEQEKKQKKKQETDDRARVKPGMMVSVHEKVLDTTPKGESRERIQIYKGMVIARKHGKEPGATIMVRKESNGVWVEKIFPVFSPIVERIVIEKIFKTRRSKLYFLRHSKKRLKEIKTARK